jgi:hypothetical protein
MVLSDRNCGGLETAVKAAEHKRLKVITGEEAMMKRLIGVLAFCLLGVAQVAMAYEFPLQFKANPGYRGLVVAGYYFQGTNVVGTCSYFTVSGGGSGKGGGARGKVKSYAQTCTWDLHGNLLSMTPGAPQAPTPVATKGDQIIYAIDPVSGDYTGTDKKLPERGFVNSPGPHYTWVTLNNTAPLLGSIAYTLTVTLKSDGDAAVDISKVKVSALKGDAKLKSTNCEAAIDVGKTCSVTLTYDPTKVTGIDEVTDTLRVDLTSNAGGASDFIQNFIIFLSDKGN